MNGRAQLSGLLLLLVSQVVYAANLATPPLVRETVGRHFPAAGEVVTDTVKLGARIGGRLANLIPRPGDVVTAEEVLAHIDTPELEARNKQLQAELSALIAEYDDARADEKRLQHLSGSQAVSEDTLRNARVRRNKANAAVAAHRATISILQVDLEEQVLRSPARLRITRRLAEPGDTVVANAPLLEAEEVNGLRFDTYVAIERLAGLKTGQALDLQFDGQVLSGMISRILRSADPVTRRCRIEIGLPEETGLIVGQYGIARLPAGSESVLLVPIKSLAKRAGIQGLFVLGTDRRVRFRSVRTGRQIDGRLVVLSGVEEGERVLLQPKATTRDSAMLDE